jgi:P22 coat protein - gene protein 5
VSNSSLTIDMITFKALDILEMNSPLIRNINRQYDSAFAVEGAKIGSSLRVRLPDRCLVTDGAALSVQDDNEQYTTMTLTNQKHVGLNFTTAEMKMNIDDFAERKLKPRISQLASSIEADIATYYKDIYQSVGTPGTTPSTSLVLLQGQQKLNEINAMMDPRIAVVNPAANAGLVEGLKGLFHSGPTISKQFRTGMMGADVLGYNEIAMGQGITTHTSGTLLRTAGATTVKTTIAAEGASSIVLTQGSVTTTLKKGDVFTIAGVYSVNPQSRVSTGALQQFVVNEDVAFVSGDATVSVSPAIYTAGHALATVDSFPQATAVVTVMGAVSGVYPQNLIFHENALTMATADLLMPQGVDMASRQVHNGISMRIVRQYDINNDRMPCRIDVLYGVKVLRPELGVRLWG